MEVFTMILIAHIFFFFFLKANSGEVGNTYTGKIPE